MCHYVEIMSFCISCSIHTGFIIEVLFFFFVSASRQTRVPEDEQAEMTEITKADTNSTPFSILYITSSEDKIIKSSRKTKVLSQEKQIIKS